MYQKEAQLIIMSIEIALAGSLGIAQANHPTKIQLGIVRLLQYIPI
jgi:hypothetical protein